MRWRLPILLLLCPSGCFCQSDLRFDLQSGTGLNPGLMLNQHPVEQPAATLLQTGLGILVPVNRKATIRLETGIFAKYIHNSGQVNLVRFKIRTLRALIPVTCALYRNGWKFATGLSIQNNRDFDQMIWKQAYNIRLNGVANIGYFLSDRLSLSLEYAQSLSRPGDSSFIADPRFSILAGVSFSILRDQP